MEEIKSHTDYICQSVKNPDHRTFMVRVINMIPDKISIVFLEPSPYGHHIGYYKWWFIDEFFSIFKLTPSEKQTPKEVIDELFLSGEREFRQCLVNYKKSCGNIK
jgi:hypothetical protein